MARLFNLPRAVDLRLFSNRFAALASAAAGAVVFGWESRRTGPALATLGPAANAAISTFLAWALARELDPDRPRSANTAAVLAGLAAVAFGEAALAALFALLLGARVLVRSTGQPPTPLEALALAGLAFLAARAGAGWPAGLLLAFALARDHRLPQGGPSWELVFGFLAAVAATASVTLAQALAGPWSRPGLGALAAAGAGTIAGVISRPYLPISRADMTGEVLQPRRLQSARRSILATLLLAAVVAGDPGITQLAAGWATVVAVAVVDYRIVPPG